MGSTHLAWWKGWYIGPGVVAVGAWMAVLATLAPHRAGPGISCDELYHTLTAKRQVWALARYGLGFFTPPVVQEVFPFQPGGPPAHPPLVHWVFGLVHWLVDPAPEEKQVVSIVGARLGGALGYGLLVLLVGLWTARHAGPLAGTTAALACAMMPRVFAHGHFAALEIWTALALLGAALAAAWAETSTAGRPELRWLAAGTVWGLALLTRFHAVLLGPVLFGWLLLRWLLLRRNGHCPACGILWQKLGIWSVGAAAVFFAGWPWLWYSPLEQLQLYLASATQRQPIHVYYLGRVWFDYEVPWHYPWLIFGSTVPVGLLVLGLVGLWAVLQAWPTRPQGAILASLAGAGLGLFSWPGVPVYDGERLFLFVYPIWAIFVGLGCLRVQEVLLRWVARNGLYNLTGGMFRVVQVPLDRLIGGGLLLMVALQGVGLVLYHPCQLSYYNLLVGGLAGAERIGLEVNYWADAVREPLLQEAAAQAPGQTVFFAPHLAPFQAPGIAISSPALAESQTELVGWDPAVHAPPFRRDRAEQARQTLPDAQTPSLPPITMPPGERLPSTGSPENRLPPLSPSPANQTQKPAVGWLIVYHRKADLAAVEPLLVNAPVVAEYSLRGVWLARLLKLPNP